MHCHPRTLLLTTFVRPCSHQSTMPGCKHLFAKMHISFFVDSLFIFLLRDICIIWFLDFSRQLDLHFFVFILFYWMLHGTSSFISTRAKKRVEIDMYDYLFMDNTLTSHSHPRLILCMNWFNSRYASSNIG